MNKKRLLVINPKTENQQRFKYFPPISLGIIAALTPQNWEVTTIDENINEITSTDFSLVAITATHNINRAYEIAKMFRNRSVTVVMGGGHVLAVPDEACEYADAIVLGDAEPVWSSVIKDFESGQLKKTYLGNPGTYEFVVPALKQFKNEYFAYALETSRGCFNNCRFCGIHIPFHQPYRRKPVDMVIKELKNTKNPFVFIIDNNFYGADEDYLFSLFQEIELNKIKKVFFAAVSVGFFKNENLVAKAAKSGLKMVFVGFESDSKQSLKEIDKKNFKAADQIFDEYKAIIDISHKYKILVSGKVMIGFQKDTEELINKRFDFFSKLKLDEISCVILSPLPGSYYFKKFRDEGRLFHTNFPEDWIKYDYMYNTFRHDTMSKETIEELQLKMNSLNRPDKKQMLRSFLISKSFKGLLLFYAYTYYFFNYKNSFFHFLLKSYTVTKKLAFPQKNIQKGQNKFSNGV